MAGELLPFRLLTPTGVVFEGEVRQVTAENPLGEFGVLPAHVDYITALEPGLVVITLPDGALRFVVVSGGLAEVKDGVMTVLAPSAERAEDLLDREAISREILTAEERLRHVSFYEPEFMSATRALRLAQARQRALEIRRA